MNLQSHCSSTSTSGVLACSCTGGSLSAVYSNGANFDFVKVVCERTAVCHGIF